MVKDIETKRLLKRVGLVKANHRKGCDTVERTFDAVLVAQCAPTLVGIKPASLFRYQHDDHETLAENVRRLARALGPHGIAIRILKKCSKTGTCLIYLYRAGWLRRILAEPSNRKFLIQTGYHMGQGCGGLMEQLGKRLCLAREFPHEIGVFLGYPLEDVIGFIENQGRNYTCSGYWKAYGDPQEARKRFDRYRHCTESCLEQFRQCGQVTQLVAA